MRRFGRAGFVKDARGGIAVTTAILLPALAGFAGLGVEIGTWYFERRAMQGAADAAAFSAAIAAIAGTSWSAEGFGVAAQDGFTNGVNGVVVAVNNPPTQGKYAGNTKAYEVIISRPMALTFSRAVGVARGPVITARGVAMTDFGADDCVLALSPNADKAIGFKGTVNLNMPNCGIADNSTKGDAFFMNGTTSLTAASLTVAGGDSITPNANLSVTATNAALTANPYAGVVIPTATQKCSVSGNAYSEPTGYTVCYLNQDVNVNGGANVTFGPGTYVLDGASIKANSGTVTGSGVTFFLTNTKDPTKTGTVFIGGNVTATLSAPTSGPYKGILFYQDPRASGIGTDTVTGTSSSNYDGAMVFANQQLKFAGNTQAGSAGCLKLIAKTIEFDGNTRLNNAGCSTYGVKQIGATMLVE